MTVVAVKAQRTMQRCVFQRINATARTKPDSSIFQGRYHKSTTVQDIVSALRSIVGEHHITIQMIEQRSASCSKSKTEEFALGLARLALAEPKDMPEQAKKRLQHTSANHIR